MKKNSYPRVQLGNVARNLVSERQIIVKPDDEVIDPTINSKTHSITIKQSQKGIDVKVKRRIRIENGDLVFSTLHTQNGLFAFANRSYLATSSFLPLRIDDRKIDKTYLFWALHLFVSSLHAADRVGRETYRPADILRLEIPLPPLNVQKQIAQEIIQMNSKISEMHTAFSKSMVEAKSLKKMVMREVFELRKGWEQVDLEDVCSDMIDNLHSTPIYSESGIPCIRSPDVGWGKINLEGALRTSEEEFKNRIRRGAPCKDDIVFVREGGGIGKAAIVEDGQRFSLGQRVMMFRPNPKIVLPKFFLYQLLSPLIYDDQIVANSGGRASPHLNISDLRRFKFNLPSLKDQAVILNDLESFFYLFDEFERLQETFASDIKRLLASFLGNVIS